MRNTEAAVVREPAFPSTLSVARRAPAHVEQTPQPRLRSEELFRNGHNELLIEHRGECYRLRLTRHDKLILNK